MMTSEEWNNCQNGAEMLRAAERVNRKLLVMAACACARLALPFVPDGEGRPLRAIEAAEGWVRGEVGIEVVREAADAAGSAADSAADSAAANAAAWSAVHAADVAYAHAAHACTAAYHVGDAYADVAYARVGDAYARAFAQCADLVRAHIPYRLVAVAVLEGV